MNFPNACVNNHDRGKLSRNKNRNFNATYNEMIERVVIHILLIHQSFHLWLKSGGNTQFMQEPTNKRCIFW